MVKKNTSITLGEHFDSFIASQLKRGRYASASEIVRAGLRLLENEEMVRESSREKGGKRKVESEELEA